MTTGESGIDKNSIDGKVTVIIRSLFGFKDITGARETSVTVPEKTTVRGFLDFMVERWGEELAKLIYHPDSRELHKHIQIMINGQSITFLDGMDTELNEGDQFLIFPPVGGG